MYVTHVMVFQRRHVVVQDGQWVAALGQEVVVDTPTEGFEWVCEGGSMSHRQDAEHVCKRANVQEATSAPRYICRLPVADHGAGYAGLTRAQSRG